MTTLLVLLTSCTSAAHHPLTTSTPRATLTSAAPSDGAEHVPPGACPITRPVAHQNVPKAVVDAVDPGHQGSFGKHDFDYWYGNDALWVELPPGGDVTKSPDEELSEKFPWVRLVRGHLSIEGRRLDGAAAPAVGDASTGYGRIGLQASGVVFPTTGCWELTGTVTGGELTFVVEVRRESV